MISHYFWKNPKMFKTIWPLTIWLKRVKIAIALGSLALCLSLAGPFAASGQQSKKSSGKQPAAAPADQSPAKQPGGYNRFTHQSHLGLIKVPNTNFARDLKCESCHERPSDREIESSIIETTDRNKKLGLKFPGHKACVDCHVVQFTTKPQQTCVICHKTDQGLIARPPQRDFPQRYDLTRFSTLSNTNFTSLTNWLTANNWNALTATNRPRKLWPSPSARTPNVTSAMRRAASTTKRR